MGLDEIVRGDGVTQHAIDVPMLSASRASCGESNQMTLLCG